MIHLMNSAVMTAPGVYTYRKLTQAEFVGGLYASYPLIEFKSYIGYPQTAEHIQRLSGLKVPVCRDQTVLHDGDVMLVCKLAYRVADPKTKGQPVPEDWEYFRVEYRA